MTRRDAMKLFAALGLLPKIARSAFAASPPKDAASATAAFGCDLFARLRDKPGNLFFSPLSIETALAMTSGGARGETLAEMTKVLHLPEKEGHVGVGDLIRSLQAGPGAKYELAIANALWGQQGLPFKQEFLAESKQHYGAGLNTVDFHQPEEARQKINRWVERQTKDKIKDLFAAGAITPDYRLALTNAIYFKGRWEKVFNRSVTRDEPFKLAGGGTVQAPLMRQGGHYRYFGGGDLQAVDLPYAGGTVSMLVVLPATPDGLPAVEKSLSAETLRDWNGRLRQADGDVMLPRFKTTDGFDLGDTLQSMGMKLAFSDDADFGGLCDERLKIAKVVHKAFVDTNEEGTEAAAATGVGMKLAAAAAPRERFKFRADRPFLFVIRDTANNTPLFVGRVANPMA